MRLPTALLLLAVVAFVLVTRGDEGTGAPSGSPLPSIEPIALGGELRPSEITAPTATATPTPTPAATPTPVPTPAATADTFRAEIFACRSVSDSRCRGELDRLGRNTDLFVALIRFSGSRAGDTIEAQLRGSTGTIPGGPFTLEGGGNGYYYSTLRTASLPPGEYTLVALRNGEEVASRRLVKRD